VPRVILLHVPWGLLGSLRDRTEISSPEAVLDTGAVIAPLLWSDSDPDLELNDRPDTLEPLAESHMSTKSRAIIWEPPVPLLASEPQSLRHREWRSDLIFQWTSAIDRPLSRGDHLGNLSESGARWYQFLLGIMARLKDFEAAISDAREPWDFVLERWLYPAMSRDPTMDIVVRHAQDHRGRWAEIAEHPRRVLSRQRELVALSRVQELDVQCMQWLSRQAGESLSERAGPSQRILALTRFENRNTLENRVFRDLLDRTVSAAGEYLVLNASRSGVSRSRRTTRYAAVQQYIRECRRLSLDLAGQGIGQVTELVQPNYALLHDSRYKHVWNAWQEIIQREHQMDDLWRWQRRSWAEFCKIGVILALMVQSKVRLVASSPLLLRSEHRRGEWLLHDDPLAVMTSEDGLWVAELLSGNSNEVPDLHKNLGASFWLRVSDYKGRTNLYMPIWAIHSFRGEVLLAELVSSANEAHQQFQENGKLARGLVCISETQPDGPTTVQVSEFITGICFGPSDVQLPDALGLLGDMLYGQIGSIS
jgi:hypothetical protein